MQNSESTLIATFLGYRTHEVKITPTTDNIKITLEEDAQQLDDVVVVGYGTQKRDVITHQLGRSGTGRRPETYARHECKRGSGGSRSRCIRVQYSSGDPSSGKESDIRIRGINGTPLLVIDGVPRFGENTSDGEMRLSDLNPDDIESISMLKDGAAAAVYGARAANGVILVKTKRGEDNQKVRVNYRGQFNMQQATCLPDFLNAEEFATLYNRAVDARGDDVYEKYDLNAIKSNPNLYGNENLLDYLDKFGFSTLHSLSVSGGNKFVKYYVSGGYTHMKGLDSGVGRDRFNYSAKLDAYIVKVLRPPLSLDITGNRLRTIKIQVTRPSTQHIVTPLCKYCALRPANSPASAEATRYLPSKDWADISVTKTNFNTISATLNYALPFLKGMSIYLKATVDNNNSINTTVSSPRNPLSL